MLSDTIASPIADVQGSHATRKIPVDRVGIRAIRHPVHILMKTGALQTTIAELSLYVNLAAHQRGTHMSRFGEILNEQTPLLSCGKMPDLMDTMVSRLGSTEGEILVQFPYFIQKLAPISKVPSLMDYTTSLKGELIKQQHVTTLTVVVPVTSLCPCSKEISAYGAHNQRSHITISIETNTHVWIEDLIQLAEQEASCEVFGILKRPDEKYVTERAYNNPKFVEDLVRDIACRLDEWSTVQAYSIASENFESIHNHSAYAEIRKKK